MSEDVLAAIARHEEAVAGGTRWRGLVSRRSLQPDSTAALPVVWRRTRRPSCSASGTSAHTVRTVARAATQNAEQEPRFFEDYDLLKAKPKTYFQDVDF
jgi:hypothetical protein